MWRYLYPIQIEHRFVNLSDRPRILIIRRGRGLASGGGSCLAAAVGGPVGLLAAEDVSETCHPGLAEYCQGCVLAGLGQAEEEGPEHAFGNRAYGQ